MKAKLTCILVFALLLVGCNKMLNYEPEPKLVPRYVMCFSDVYHEWLPVNGTEILMDKDADMFTVTLKSIGIWDVVATDENGHAIETIIRNPLFDDQNNLVTKPCDYRWEFNHKVLYYFQDIEFNVGEANSISVTVGLNNFLQTDHSFKLVRK